jgi:hypothetical protein
MIIVTARGNATAHRYVIVAREIRIEQMGSSALHLADDCNFLSYSRDKQPISVFEDHIVL